MNHQELSEKLREIILPILEAQGIECVELTLIRAKNRLILRLLVDKKDDRINLDECARLNSEISQILDEKDIMQVGYILEVSSPGLDRPLKTKNDFLRCINRETRFFLNESIAGKKELAGVIKTMEGDSVYIDMEGATIAIPLSKIITAKQMI